MWLKNPGQLGLHGPSEEIDVIHLQIDLLYVFTCMQSRKPVEHVVISDACEDSVQ